MCVVFLGDVTVYDREQSQDPLTSTGTRTTLVLRSRGGRLAGCISDLFLQISHQLILLCLASEAEVIDLGLETD